MSRLTVVERAEDGTTIETPCDDTCAAILQLDPPCANTVRSWRERLTQMAQEDGFEELAKVGDSRAMMFGIHLVKMLSETPGGREVVGNQLRFMEEWLEQRKPTLN